MSDKIDSNAGVLGYAFDIRTEKDKQLMINFSCNRNLDKNETKENYLAGVSAPNMFIEPRTVKDQMLLATFNSCACRENYRR